MSTLTPRPPADLCKTGIEGLDDILNGGLPRNRLYLVNGEPGVGKTTLALQFLLAGKKLGERGLYITLSETKSELSEVAASHGWDLSTIELFELSALESQIKLESDTTFFSPSDVELHRTTKALLDQVEQSRPLRVVFDSLSELRLMSETALRYRRQILHLKQFFAGRSCTVLMLDDGAGEKHVDDQVESLAHGVIVLSKTTPFFGVARRQVCVKKIRAVNFREGYHDMLLQVGGFVAFPRLVAAEHHAPFAQESLSSDIPGLDKLLGGGINRGTSTAIMGSAGTGKTTLAMQFAVSAARRGDKAMFFTFEENLGTLITRSGALGMGTEELLQSGKLLISQVDPAETTPGEFTYRIKEAVQRDGVNIIAIDSINGYLHAMADQRHLMLQLHELLTFLNQQGVSTLLVMAQRGITSLMQDSIDLSYLADGVVLLRFFESAGVVRQAISVVKKRSGNHERTIREFAITPSGVQVGEPLRGFQGVLTGTPTILGDGKTAATWS